MDKTTRYLINSTPGAGGLAFKDHEDIAREAQQRALKRVEQREHLRLELKARDYIMTCHTVADTLVSGYEVVRDAQGRPVPGPLDRARVQALRGAADVVLKLLDRVLPPLKAVEVQDSPEKEVKDYSKMTTGELMRLFMEQRSIPGEVVSKKITRKPPWE